MPVGLVVDASGRVVEVPVRDLRNRTRDVMELVEQGWTVYLTNHGRRFAALNPLADPVAAPLLAALLADLDTAPPEPSDLSQFVAASRAADRLDGDPVADPWR